MTFTSGPVAALIRVRREEEVHRYYSDSRYRRH
jgi:hypothetical protein